MAILVPNRPAVDELRRTLENLLLVEGPSAGAPAPAIVIPEIVTREGFYDRLHARQPAAPPRLSRVEREVMMGAAGRAADAAPPFPLRPGLVAAMLDFYDAVRRLHVSVDAFERLLAGELEPAAESDRGAERLLVATRFLAAAWRGYERRVNESSRLDEHALRARLLETPCVPPFTRVVVTVADHAAEPAGLWPADFDLLARLAGLEHLDVIATENLLATGYHERLFRSLPGFVEERLDDRDGGPVTLVAPADQSGPVFISRDREEELIDLAGLLRRRAREEAAPAAAADPRSCPIGDRLAVVVQRPLPYIYLARQVFGAAGLPFQTFDALPLAAEPYAALLDLVLAFVSSGFSRAAAVALIDSTLLRFEIDGRAIDRTEVASLDRAFREAGYAGDLGRLESLAARWSGGEGPDPRPGGAGRAALAVLRAARELEPLTSPQSPVGHIDSLLAFLAAHEAPIGDRADDARHLRARAAVQALLKGLRAAHERHDPSAVPFDEVAASIRRWIEQQTFAPRTGDRGPHLIDASAARYGDFDEVRILGLVEIDWPERPERNIFYPTRVLAPLDWPRDTDRLRAARAAFRDLLSLARLQVSASAFSLEDDAVVGLSTLVDEVGDVPAVRREPSHPRTRILADEALSARPVAPAAIRGQATLWLDLRGGRTARADPRFHGSIGPRAIRGPYSVTGVETYLGCPFRYFARQVLRLPEEQDDETGLTAMERGRFLHRVFGEFYRAWADTGRGAIALETLGEARALFARVVERLLPDLPEGDRAVERARLLGSAAAAGLGERALELEVEWSADIVDRLVEHPLDGEVTLLVRDRERRVDVRGRADRIDLLRDGTLRLIDYKLGRPPRKQVAVQLPVYGAAAVARLEGHRGRRWSLGAAGYLAFGERDAFRPLASAAGFEVELAEGRARFLDAIAGIEAGAYPPRPFEVFRCELCPFPVVCRKDYME